MSRLSHQSNRRLKSFSPPFLLSAVSVRLSILAPPSLFSFSSHFASILMSAIPTAKKAALSQPRLRVVSLPQSKIITVELSRGWLIYTVLRTSDPILGLKVEVWCQTWLFSSLAEIYSVLSKKSINSVCLVTWDTDPDIKKIIGV